MMISQKSTLSTALACLACALCFGSAFSACAQIVPLRRQTVAVVDPSMVLNDRGMKIEIYATTRVTLMTGPSGRSVIQSVQKASAESPISALQPGVLFNHSMQQYGYFSGEIALQLKGPRDGAGSSPSASLASLPGFARIGTTGTYVVRARNSAEFAQLLTDLNARTDLTWVEPTIIYGPAPSLGSAVQ